MVRQPAPIRLKLQTLLPLKDFAIPTVARLECSGVEFEGSLPINLRHFLAERFGHGIGANGQALMNLATAADERTLSKLARAIRQFSTEHAREVWSKCAVALDSLCSEGARALAEGAAAATLCLRCNCIDFGSSAAETHQRLGCVAVDLSRVCKPMRPRAESGAKSNTPGRRLQSIVEEFRDKQAASGLPHYDLDCYVTNGIATFTWRPVAS